jgi:redox-sensitive bicupin YhaK (pirin superfamily)
MKRGDFIRKLTSGVLGLSVPFVFIGQNSYLRASKYNNPMSHQAEKNIKKITNMKTVIHKAETRGYANHGWLETYHTFSFANYYNPERMNFGALRVLNDDTVAGGKGFGKHPHDNMEIISIPLEGDLEHKDSMGNVAVIKEGDVQIMSAGTGIFHSEYNKNHNREVRFLQIWVMPNKKNVEPRYDQISIREIEKPNKFYQILSPNNDEQGVWIHQEAWFHMGKFNEKIETVYDFKKEGNGVYAFVLEGNVEIAGHSLERRDGIGLWNTPSVEISIEKDSRVLLMEVPMNLNHGSN